MNTGLISLAAPLSLTMLTAACGSDKKSTSTSAASTASAPTATTVGTTTTTAAANALTISVTVGSDSSPTRVEHVPLGATVTLELTDPNADEEYHVHGYDLGEGTEVPKGTTSKITFVADKAGTFEVESHKTDEVLVQLQVG